jgi:PucR family transcriptional regulator, purine catabolism regulatory protein
VPTVGELLAEGLPSGAVVRSGFAGLARNVSWAIFVRTNGPDLAVLRGGELALVSFTAVAATAGLGVSRAVDALIQAGVSAICYVGQGDHAAETAARAADVPLIELPPGQTLRNLETVANRFLTERRHDAYTSAQRLYAELARLALDGASVERVLARLAERADCRAALLDADVSPRASWPHLDQQAADQLESLRPDVLAWVDRLGEIPAEPPTYSAALNDAGKALIFAPLVHSGQLDGFLCLWTVGPAREADVLAATRGASACAVALARERAAAEATDQLRGDFLSELRASEVSDEQVLARARRLGFDLSLPHVPLALSPATPDRAREAIRLIRREVAVPVGPADRGDGTVLLFPVAASDRLATESEARDQALKLQRAFGSVSAQPCVGVGRAGSGVLPLRQGLDEAEQALGLGRTLFGPGRLTHIVDLGVHRLLSPLVRGGDLAQFRREHLGALEEYDQQAGGELIKTLKAYFASRGSPTLTARALHLHRNSLLYRLQRIREIAGVDLDDPEARLRLEIALRSRDLLDAQS